MRFSFGTRYWYDYRYYAILSLETDTPTRVAVAVVDDFGTLVPVDRRRGPR